MAKWVATLHSKSLQGRRTSNTLPEVMLRRALHALGARFRLHRVLAPGCSPDIILPKRHIAVFVDGDFWHCCPVHGRKIPFTGPNAALWETKINRTRERDARSTLLAEQAGWTVVRVWECAIRRDARAAAQQILDGESPPPAD
jgi:DNA mismatch endonuclease, patch repair protein